jgi:hypothetical protein
LTCPNTDTDHSDQSVPVLFAPPFLEVIFYSVPLSRRARELVSALAGRARPPPRPGLAQAARPAHHLRHHPGRAGRRRRRQHPRPAPPPLPAHFRHAPPPGRSRPSPSPSPARTRLHRHRGPLLQLSGIASAGRETAGQQVTGPPERRSARPDASRVTWEDPAVIPSDARSAHQKSLHPTGKSKAQRRGELSCLIRTEAWGANVRHSGRRSHRDEAPAP